MKCSKAQKLLLDYVYEELPPGKVLEFERHTRQCPECAKALQEVQFTRKAFKNVEVKVPSGAAVEKVLAAARQASAPQAGPARRRKLVALRTAEFWQPFLVGAACLLFVVTIAQVAFHPFTVEKLVIEYVRQPQTPLVQPAGTSEYRDFRRTRILLEQRDLFREILPAVDDAITAGSLDGWREAHRKYLGNVNTGEKLLRESLLNSVMTSTIDPGDAESIDKKLHNAFLLMINGYPYEAFCLLKLIEQKAPDYEKIRGNEKPARQGSLLFLPRRRTRSAEEGAGRAIRFRRTA
ncbi:unnamed protein product, partial [marine sediment metagenome]